MLIRRCYESVLHVSGFVDHDLDPLDLKALCHYIVLNVTKNNKSTILRAPQNGGKLLTSAHELVYAIAYSLVEISVIVNKTKSGQKRRDFSMEEKKYHGV